MGARMEAAQLILVLSPNVNRSIQPRILRVTNNGVGVIIMAVAELDNAKMQ